MSVQVGDVSDIKATGGAAINGVFPLPAGIFPLQEGKTIASVVPIRARFAVVFGKSTAVGAFQNVYRQATLDGYSVAEIGTVFSPMKTGEQVLAIREREFRKLVKEFSGRRAKAGQVVDMEEIEKAVEKTAWPAPLGIPEKEKGKRGRKSSKALVDTWCAALEDVLSEND